MKYTNFVNQIVMRRLILGILCIQGVLPSINAASDVLVARKKIYQKSLLDLYKVEGKQGACIPCKPKTCVTCKVRKCHANHTYCTICEEKCQKCPKNCNDCKVSCAICLENHRQKGEKEIVLECNHVFGVECIKSWENVSKQGDCPVCRKVIAYKMCAVCNETIYEWQPSCEYDCDYRCWGWEREHHVFHSECIVPFAVTAARYSDKATQDLKNADITFHCPVLHKKGSNTSKTDLKVPLCKVIPANQIEKKLILAPSAIRDKNRCDHCHRAIMPDQKRSSYTCNYRAFSWHREEHNFHEECLKPYAEVNAHKQKLYGKETGKVVFNCPYDHDHGVWNPESDLEIDLALLPGFKPAGVEFSCAVCNKHVEIDNPQTITTSFSGFPEGLLNVDCVQEINYYHPKCFGEFVAKYAHKKATSWWGGAVKVVYPCPCHEGTKWAHDYELPKDFPIDAAQ